MVFLLKKDDADADATRLNDRRYDIVHRQHGSRDLKAAETAAGWWVLWDYGAPPSNL